MGTTNCTALMQTTNCTAHMETTNRTARTETTNRTAHMETTNRTARTETTNYKLSYYGSLLFCIIFLGSDLYSFLFYTKLYFNSFLVVWVCGTMPRFHYDK
jgi:hypothetical protein